MLGIYVHQLKDSNGNTTSKGKNPFDNFEFSYPVYDWVVDDGYNNMGDWIEKAAKDAGR